MQFPGFNIPGFNCVMGDPMAGMAIMEATPLNNRGVELNGVGRHREALGFFKKALAVKIKATGFVSMHTCISLSGYADSFLGLREFDNAFREARRMLQIAGRIKDANQERIAKEILADIEKQSGVKRDPAASFEDLATITIQQYA